MRYIITHEPEREGDVGSVGVVLGVESAESASSALSKWARRVLSGDFNSFLDRETKPHHDRASRRTDLALGVLKMADRDFDRDDVVIRQLASDEYNQTWESTPQEVFGWETP